MQSIYSGNAHFTWMKIQLYAESCCNIYSLPGIYVAPEVMFGRFHAVGIHTGLKTEWKDWQLCE